MANENLPAETADIERRIFLIRGRKVMLDADLARLYGVETGALNRAVKRNAERFPEDFMSRLSLEEAESLRCQIGISKKGRGGRRFLPMVFSEQGIAMLSGVLTSKKAVRANIAIMRAFVRLRQMVSAHAELASKLKELERRIEGHDESIRSLFDAIEGLISQPEPKRGRIGSDPG